MINLNNKFITIDNLDTNNKTVMIRVDFNCPLDIDKRIVDISRIKSHLNTINFLKDSKVVIITHQGRPGNQDFTTTMEHSIILSNLLNRKVKYIDDIFGSKAITSIKSMKKGDILILENVRFYSEESLVRSTEDHEKSIMVNSLKPFIDIFVNDAFSVSHRSHLSVIGFSKCLPYIAGKLMESELNNLNMIYDKNIEICYCLGGKKVKDTLEIVSYILSINKNSIILLSGLIGILSIAALGYNINRVNEELLLAEDCLKYKNELYNLIIQYSKNIYYPLDIAFESNGNRVEVDIENVKEYNFKILDIGSKTIDLYSKIIEKSKNIILNGPCGKSEVKNFEIGTQRIILSIKKDANSLVCGGHTINEINKLKDNKKEIHIKYQSYGGKACIQYLSGLRLPGVEALRYYYNEHRK